jgi:chorismate lyase / 3-hydroxybenzoate synthase
MPGWSSIVVLEPELKALERTACLQVTDRPVPGLSSLMAFGFDSRISSANPTGLAWLGGDLAAELWQVDQPLASGIDSGIAWQQAGDLLFMAWQRPDDGRTDPAILAEQAYRDLISLAEQRGCPKLLRAWNFMAAINRGQGDAERYRRFCLGRACALEVVGIHEPELCAGTAIGGDDPSLRVYVLAGRRAGINIENPRQVSAYRYPRIYGPRSPSFARATALSSGNDQMVLMISGTASVVGHQTLHAGDLDRQLDEIVTNLEALLAESVRRLKRPGLASFGSGSLMRAYVRHGKDWPAVRDRLAEAWPQARVVGLRGDICRSDLLVEIEAVTAA